MTPEQVVTRSLQRQGADTHTVEAALRDWRLIDTTEGVLMLRGTELHFAPAPWFRPRRSVARRHVAELLSEHGYLTTRTLLDQTNPLVKLLGFTPTWDDGKYQFYILTEPPFGEKRCHK